MGGITNFFRRVKRIGNNIGRAMSGNIGLRISREATKRLKQTQDIASVVERSPILPVSLMAGAVKAGAKLAEQVVEVGKDIDIAGTGRGGGRAGIEKAKKRLPTIAMEAGKTVAGVEGAALFL
mgnify:FL=1|jgi:hypothetical protein|tara:strand:+ start:492 stop:860 length:369 start_codon:yes stop_codon:yes gene_type:complete